MLVTINRAKHDSYKDGEAINITINEKMAMNNSGETGENAVNYFRYRNKTIFVTDCVNNLQNDDLFYIISRLQTKGVTYDLLVNPICALLCGAKVELSQIFVINENNSDRSYVQSEICSLTPTKKGIGYFADSIEDIVTPEQWQSLKPKFAELLK